MALQVIALIATISVLYQMAAAGTIAPTQSASRNAFSMDIFNALVKSKDTDNFIFSPASIQSCLTLAFMGAAGETEQELRHALKLGAGTKSDIAKEYNEFINSRFNSDETKKYILKLANRIFVNDKLKLAEKFNDVAQKFGSSAESLNFADAGKSVQQINQWVEAATENKISNVLTDGDVNAETSALLVNAIYFKAKWRNQFAPEQTRKEKFTTSQDLTSQVDMMFQDDRFNYAELEKLNAKALQMDYADSDLSMLILLPNNVDGLKDLENNLKGIDFNELDQELQGHSVDVSLPKFRIEFEVDLKEPLQQLGVKKLFGDDADLSELFANAQGQKVSDARHKAYLDVSEGGSEAAATTVLKIVPMSLNFNQKRFVADHPFVFAIRDKTAVYFIGHVVKF